MTKTNRLDFIDFAKGVAIFSIIAFHFMMPFAEGWLAKAIVAGGAGVHLFFLLSGFGLGFSVNRFSFTVFFRKRFTALLVPYYLAILLITAVNLIIEPDQAIDIYALAGHIFLFKMFDEAIINSFGLQFWFISTIIQLYLLFPILLLLQKRFGNHVFFTLALCASIAYWILVYAFELENLRIFNSSAFQFLWEFALGMLLAERYRHEGYRFWEQPSGRLLACGISGMALMAGMAIFGGASGKVFNDIPAALGFGALTAFAYRSCGTDTLLGKLFIRIGVVSLELYLLHMLVFAVALRLIEHVTGQPAGFFITLSISMPLTMLAASVFSRLQKPIAARFSAMSKLRPQSPLDGR